STEGNLLVGETATYTATYQINQSDVDSGGITNSVVANGLSPANTAVSDISDNGNDTDGNTTDDNTVIAFAENPSTEETKTASVAGNEDGRTGVGDVVTYTISVLNTGNVGLQGITLADTFRDAQGKPLALAPGPAFHGADHGSAEGNLLVGETPTYTPTYHIKLSEGDAGELALHSFPTRRSSDLTAVSDISDNGNDTDGNTTDD